MMQRTSLSLSLSRRASALLSPAEGAAVTRTLRGIATSSRAHGQRHGSALSQRGGYGRSRGMGLGMFTPSLARYSEQKPHDGATPHDPSKIMVPFEEIQSDADLLPPGAQPGTMPTDLEQATGLERFEILGKMQGVDVFDMRPLDASRKGTLDNPIIVKSAGDEQFAGCTGYPVDSHWVIWLGLSRTRPMERCPECGGVYKMDYIGPADDEAHGHGHGHEDGHSADHSDAHHNFEEPKTFADFVRPEYRGAPEGFKHPERI